MIRHGRFTIYGDGSQTRDFIHVDDVVEACIKAMDVRDCTVVNVGTGIETSFNEVAEMIREHIPLEIHYKENPVKNYVERTCADTRNMRRLLKFTPKVDLRTGIERQVEMYGSEKR
jgi:UDP-glucose 4-epimerase